jgi:hypothetical protein
VQRIRKIRVSILDHDVDREVHCTENAALSRGYQLIASCIVNLFNLCVSMMPPDRVERARAQIVSEEAVVGINIGLSDSDVPNHGHQRASRTNHIPRR